MPEGFEEVEQRGELELAAYVRSELEPVLREAFGPVAAADVPAGWADAWRRFHRPVHVGPLWVGPPWEESSHGSLAVVIDPGRAFGTGGHPTTQLCLSLLAEERRGALLDVGCGSGVLAIAAARLGFEPVRAFDFDPQAVEATARNATDNGVAIDVRQADLRDGELPDSDLAVANIAADAVLALAPSLRSPRVITSGYLVSDEVELPGYRHERRVQDGGWAADLHVRE